MTVELQKVLEEEYIRIQDEYWYFLNNTYQHYLPKPYHRKKIENYIDIDNIKKEIYDVLGAIPVFVFLTEICSHIRMPTPLNNIEKGIMIIYLLLSGNSISYMDNYLQCGSFFSVYESLFVKNASFLEEWCDNMLLNCFSSSFSRLLYSKLYNPPNFEQATLLLDGKHNKITLEDINLNKKDLYSYKIKGNALNTQYIIDCSGYAIYISDSLPCRFNNDDNMLINNINLAKFFKYTDCLCFDGLYENVINEVINKYNNIGLNLKEDHFCFPFKKEKGIELKIDEANFNKQLGSFRSIIETFFANFTKTFKRFKHTSDIRVTKEKTFNIQLKLSLVLYNLRNFVNNNNIIESSFHKMWLDTNFDFFNSIEDFNMIQNTVRTEFKKESIINMTNIQNDALNKMLSDLKLNKKTTKHSMDIDIENDKAKKQKSYEIQYIIQHKEFDNGVIKYLVKWRNFKKSDSTWETEDKFDTKEVLENYWKSLRG